MSQLYKQFAPLTIVWSSPNVWYVNDPEISRLYTLTGRRVHDARQEAGISQAELGQAVGLTRTSIVNLERGRQRVPLHILFGIAEHLQKDLFDLLPRKDDLASKRSIVTVKIDGREIELDGAAGAFVQRVLETKGISDAEATKAESGATGRGVASKAQRLGTTDRSRSNREGRRR